MPKKEYKSIEALVEQIEPGKRYIILLDKRFINREDRYYFEYIISKYISEGSVVVLGDGDPDMMTHFMEADNWGHATVKLQDYAFHIAWPLPDYSDVSLKDFNLQQWAPSMVERFASKVGEACTLIKVKQEDVNSEVKPG